MAYHSKADVIHFILLVCVSFFVLLVCYAVSLICLFCKMLYVTLHWLNRNSIEKRRENSYYKPKELCNFHLLGIQLLNKYTEMWLIAQRWFSYIFSFSHFVFTFRRSFFPSL